MELYEIKNGLERAHLFIEEACQYLDIAGKEREIDYLTHQTLKEDFWQDASHAKRLYHQLSTYKKIVETYHELKERLASLEETFQLVKETEDDEFSQILEEDYTSYQQLQEDFEKEMLLSGPYDHLNVLIDIHPGAGGTESQDWAEMLYRMYTRYSQDKGFKVEVQDYLDGEEAGIKSVSFLVKGEHAYGHFKSEKGVHRLVRISPFDANKRRHTSFASVDVTPQFEEDSLEIELKSEDIRIDTYRASGAGGQHINKTDSAIRITHLPTNIVVTCQSQRSQIQNREQALLMLKSKLYQLELEKKEQAMHAIKGEAKAIEWGSQIRSYVFQPYSLVKDVRSRYETSDVQGVMDGDLDGFVYAYLKWTLQKEEEDETQ